MLKSFSQLKICERMWHLRPNGETINQRANVKDAAIFYKQINIKTM